MEQLDANGRRIQGGSCCNNVCGRLELFAVGMDGRLYRMHQNGSSAAWSSWDIVAGQSTHFDVSVNLDGRFALVTIGEDGKARCAFENGCPVTQTESKT